MTEANQYAYETRLNVLYQPLEIVDAKALADACEFKWYNQTLCQVNESVVRLGVLEGEYHWHKHDADDEFFYESSTANCSLTWKTESSSSIQARDLSFPSEWSIAPALPHRTVVLMVENKGILPTGDPAE